MLLRHKPDPYCAFKNDVERRKALRSRDVRLVLMVAVPALSGGIGSIPWRSLAEWLAQLIR